MTDTILTYGPIFVCGCLIGLLLARIRRLNRRYEELRTKLLQIKKDLTLEQSRAAQLAETLKLNEDSIDKLNTQLAVRGSQLSAAEAAAKQARSERDEWKAAAQAGPPKEGSLHVIVRRGHGERWRWTAYGLRDGAVGKFRCGCPQAGFRSQHEAQADCKALLGGRWDLDLS